MTVTESRPRRGVHRHGGVPVVGRRPGVQTPQPARAGRVSPFAPDPHSGVTVRTWRGAGDLAEFSRAVPTAVPDPSRFLVQSRSARFGEFDVTYMAHSPLRWGTAGRNFGHPVRTLRIVVVLDGEITLRQDDAVARLGRRDGALVVGWHPVVYETRAPARIVTCDVPASHPSIASMPERAPYVVGTSETALLPALAAFLCDLLRHDADALAPAIRAQVTDTLDALVSGVLSSLATSDDVEWARRSARMRAIRYITAHYADPDLNPSSLAAHLGMSKRSLQRLFEGEEMGVSQWIHTKRLEQAMARLGDPRYANTSLEDVAQLSGFGNALTLRRAVQSVTGKTPSELRAAAAR